MSLDMSPDGIIDKKQGVDLDYEFDFSSGLSTGESITSFTLRIPSGLGVGGAGVGAASNTTSAVQFAVSGGTVGINYQLVCNIVTDNSGPRKNEKVMTIKCIK